MKLNGVIYTHTKLIVRLNGVIYTYTKQILKCVIYTRTQINTNKTMNSRGYEETKRTKRYVQ